MSLLIENGASLSGNGPLVVFLHSSLSSSKQWLSLVQALNPRFSCLNIDLYGYGSADPVPNDTIYSFETETQRIKKIIDKVKPGEPFHLVGHSCGGAIAIKLAAESPEKTLSLSLFEPIPFYLYDEGNQIRLQVEDFDRHISSLDDFEAAEYFIDFFNDAGFFKAAPEPLQNLMIRDITKARLETKATLKESIRFDDLATISCPCLILHGKYSPAIGVALCEEIAAHLPDAQLKEINSGHMAPITHSNIVDEVIVTFFSDIQKDEP